MTDSMKILIVEDDEDYALLIKDYLRDKWSSQKLTLHHAVNFKNALELIETNGTFDLYIFDYLLNHINGIELIQAVRHRGIDSPIIFLTGYGNEEIAVTALKTGATDYISKAKLTPELLHHSVHHALEVCSFERQKKRYDEELRIKNEELAKLNYYLEQRVNEEVKKNKDREHMFILQNRQAAMGEMFSYIAHQWKQPLNAIGLIIQTMEDVFKEEGYQEAFFQEEVKKVMSLIQHMACTIDDFKHFLVPDRQKSHCILGDVISKTINLIQDSFKANHIAIHSEIRVNRPVWCLPNQLCHVLINILNNARDALIQRMIKDPWVKIVLDFEDDRSVISISDNAGGIDESIIDKIFDPYITTKKEGSGIGLYMSKLMIEKNMNGHIYARNTDEGAEFVIELP